MKPKKQIRHCFHWRIKIVKNCLTNNCEEKRTKEIRYDESASRFNRINNLKKNQYKYIFLFKKC